MTILKRLKNIWSLSEYRAERSNELISDGVKVLKKDITTVEKRLVTIIQPEKADPFKPEEDGEIT